MVRRNKLVRKSGVSNAEGCKFQVNSPWNLELLEELLSDYEDKDVVKYLKYGWPLNTFNTAKSREVPKNQAGVTENSKLVHDYLKKERSINPSSAHLITHLLVRIQGFLR